MAIHIEIGYRDGFMDKGKPLVKVIDKSFAIANEALTWWLGTGFNDGDGSVEDVLKAAGDEYVGTEHEIMTPGVTGKSTSQEGGYTKLWCIIEGQEGKDTFDDRFKDLHVTEVIYMGECNGVIDLQLNGHDTDNKRVWQSIHLKPGFTFKISEVINLPE
jgi:hypothetical protein